VPRKGAATAAPKPTENLGSEETMGEVAYNESVAEETKPARTPRKTAAERAAEREANKVEVEDWTRPDYADNPGEVLYDQMDDSDEFYRILWWGVEGTGKTTDVAMVTRIIPSTKGRVLMINAEAGAKKSALAHHGVDTSRIALYPPRGQQLTFEGLERLFYRVQADLEQDPESWGAVLWDSITAIYQKLLDDVVEADIRKTAEILQRAKKGRDGRSGNITLRDRFESDRDDYATMSNQVRLLLRKYRSLHCHLLVTALERRDEVGKGKDKVIEYGPAVSPALLTDLLGYMDAVLHCKVNSNGVYYGRSQPTENTRGKDRLNVLPVELVDPTVERVHRYVTGDLTDETDRAQRRLPDRDVAVRHSLADEYPDLAEEDEARYHTKDGTPDGPPLAGDKDDDPPKRPARRGGASSGRTRASAPANVPEPEETKPVGGELSDPLKRGGRRTARSSAPAAASTTPDESAGPPSGSDPDNPPDGTTGKGRSSGRKTAADRAARAAVKADTEPSKRGPATRRASARAKDAQPASGFPDEPPF
jgi:AAA domain-containing protein